MDSRGKVPCQGMNSDRISNLREEVTHSILGSMPIRDAVRTGILSRNWRHKWTSLPHLVFDVPTLSPELLDEGKLVETISRILFQHKGPVSKFSLSVKTLKGCLMVDQSLLFLSKSGAITEIILEFTDGSRYRIHSSLFSCANLRNLKLQGCVIPSPPPAIFNGFNNLTYLMFERVTFSNEGFENLIAKCPLLRTLVLWFVDGLDRLNIYHAPKLQGLSFYANQIKHISLKYTPSLLYVSLASFQLPDTNQNLGNEESTLTYHLNHLSDIREFGLGRFFLKFLAQDSVRMQLPSTFNHLAGLDFFELIFEDMDSVSSALGLIISSPNLRELVVTAFTDSSAAQTQMKTVTEYLKEIKERVRWFVDAIEICRND